MKTPGVPTPVMNTGALSAQSARLTHAARIEGVTAYGGSHKAERPIDLKLDANEGPGPAREALEPVLRDAAALARLYPTGIALEPIIAGRFGLDPSQVVVTAGADDALERVCRAVLEPGRSAVVAIPTFEMIPRYVALAGGELRTTPWPDGPYPIDAILALITPDTRVVFLVTPNNPTGGAATRRDLKSLRDAAPQALIVLDAAYAEFADEDLTPAALAMPNVIVLRTLSKAWGLAGMRVGFAVGDPAQIEWLRRVGQPYAVGTVSLAVARRWLSVGESAMRAGVERVRQERSDLAAVLRELGLEPVQSQANFVLARTPKAPVIAQLLAGLGIGVRSFPDRPDLRDALRITCPAAPAAFNRLCAGLRTAVAPEALIFDMDGVLADVSGSYRAAIVQTCGSYGVNVSLEDIATAKAAGDANNDWVLTHRLLSARSVNAPLPEVTSRFEDRYQGTEQSPGLRSTERLMIPRTTLERLSRRAKLAIVTGRPRTDALRFLQDNGIADLFPVVVCMEDAPLKPNPAPVTLALSRLGCTRGWMLGDTVDDIRAARGAGVVPIGSVPPGESGEVSKSALLRAGAGLVLSEPAAIEEVFP